MQGMPKVDLGPDILKDTCERRSSSVRGQEIWHIKVASVKEENFMACQCR